MRGSLPIPFRTWSTLAPTRSHSSAISFMNEMRVASIAFAAYLVISADGMSMKMIGLPVRTNGAYSSRHHGARVVRLDPQHDAIRLEEIIDRRAFLEKLRIAAQVERLARVRGTAAATLAAVPTGTVDFVTTTSSRVMCRPIWSATPSTWRRSAEPSSSGGVPTAMKIDAGRRDRGRHVGRERQPPLLLVALHERMRARAHKSGAGSA